MEKGTGRWKLRLLAFNGIGGVSASLYGCTATENTTSRGRVCDPVSPVPFSVIINEIQADATLQIRNGLSRSISLFVSM